MEIVQNKKLDERKMKLLEPSLADNFLQQYKQLLSDIAGEPLSGATQFAEARHNLYETGRNTCQSMHHSYDNPFINAVSGAIFGSFVYAKPYRQGYALKYETGKWYCVTALTTPLEDLVPEWLMIRTAVVNFHGHTICDGLIVNRNIFIGKNLVHELIQELKLERQKWTSNNRLKATK